MHSIVFHPCPRCGHCHRPEKLVIEASAIEKWDCHDGSVMLRYACPACCMHLGLHLQDASAVAEVKCWLRVVPYQGASGENELDGEPLTLEDINIFAARLSEVPDGVAMQAFLRPRDKAAIDTFWLGERRRT